MREKIRILYAQIGNIFDFLKKIWGSIFDF